MAAFCAVPLLPWAIRNAVTLHEFQPLAREIPICRVSLCRRIHELGKNRLYRFATSIWFLET